jgi:hypothetical protein
MRLKDLLPSFNDRVSLFFDGVRICEHRPGKHHTLCNGTVIGKWVGSSNTTHLYLIGWTANEMPPNDRRVDFASNFNDNGTGYFYSLDKNSGKYRTAMWVSNDYEIDVSNTATIIRGVNTTIQSFAPELGKVAAPTTNAKQECKCKNKTCRATVFSDDGSCWNCGVSEPGK